MKAENLKQLNAERQIMAQPQIEPTIMAGTTVLSLPAMPALASVTPLMPLLTPRHPHREAQRFIVFGHRGARGHAAENTLSSVQAALDLGVDWIELDVWNVDGELVVIHDRRLERTTNGRGRTQDIDFAQLRRLEAGAGQQVPTLNEVLSLLASKRAERRVGLNIELKGQQTAALAVTAVQHRVLSGEFDWSDFIISSFDHRQLTEVKNSESQLRIAALYSGIPQDLARPAAKMGSFALHADINFITPELVADAHRRGLWVFVFTVNETDDLQQMWEYGVDGVFSDYPERALNFVPSNMAQRVA